MAMSVWKGMNILDLVAVFLTSWDIAVISLRPAPHAWYSLLTSNVNMEKFLNSEVKLLFFITLFFLGTIKKMKQLKM